MDRNSIREEIVKDFKEKENKIQVLEKALELACRVLCKPQIVVEPLTKIETVYGVIEYFKKEAKGIINAKES